jgi:hypothetical protein
MMGQLTGMFGGMKGPEVASEAAMRQGAGVFTGGLGAAGGGGGGVGAGGGVGGAHPGAGLTSFTRPTSSFDAATAGRATGLKPGFLDAAEMRGPTTGGMGGGSAMPMSPGMLQRGQGDGDREREANYARVVVDGDQEPRRT